VAPPFSTPQVELALRFFNRQQQQDVRCFQLSSRTVGDGRRNHALQVQAVTPPRAHGTARRPRAPTAKNPEEQSGVTLADAFTSLRERQALASLHLFLMHNVQGMLQRQNIHEGDITVVLRPV